MLIDPLSELYANLGKQEKRYLELEFARRFPAKGQLNNLWNAFRKNPSLESEKLREMFRSKSLYRNYPVIRHQLYTQMLNLLADFHDERIPEKKIAEGLSQLAVLFDKKLYAQALRLVQRLKKKAEKAELHFRLAEILGWEMRLIHLRGNPEELEKLVDKNYPELFRKIRAAEQEMKIQQLAYLNFITLKTKWVSRGAGSTPAMKDIMSLKSSEMLSSRTEILWRQTVSAHLFSIGDKEGAFDQLEALSRLMDKNPALREQHLNQYVGMLNNMNLLLFERGDYDRILANIARLRSIRTSSAEKKQRISERLLNVEMNVYKTRGHWDKASALIPQLEEHIASEKTAAVYRKIFYFDLALLYFATSNFRAALRQSRRLLQFTEISVRPDVNACARLIEIISLYELQREDDLLLIGNQFKKHPPDKLQQFVFDLVKQLREAKSAVQKKQIFSSAQRRFVSDDQIAVLRETYDRNFPAMAWIRSYTQDIPLHTAIPEAFSLPQTKSKPKQKRKKKS